MPRKWTGWILEMKVEGGKKALPCPRLSHQQPSQPNQDQVGQASPTHQVSYWLSQNPDKEKENSKLNIEETGHFINEH